MEISPLTQKLVDEGKLVLIGYEPAEVLCHVPPDTFVKRFLEPSLAKPEAPKVEVQREEKPAALGEQGKYDASVAAAIVNGKFALHIPYYRLQDIFAASGWTPSRSSIDYVSDLAAEAIVELPKLMIRRLLAGRYIGMVSVQRHTSTEPAPRAPAFRPGYLATRRRALARRANSALSRRSRARY